MSPHEIRIQPGFGTALSAALPPLAAEFCHEATVEPPPSIGTSGASGVERGDLHGEHIPLAQAAGWLLHYIRRICPSELRNREEDLAQTAALRILEMEERHNKAWLLQRAYLKKVAFCVVIDEIRALRRRVVATAHEHSEDEFLPSNVQVEVQAPDHEIGQRELRLAIQECLAKLIEPRRLALVLLLQGHSVTQAAAVLGWPAKRTENLGTRGRADLRECLTRKGQPQ